MLKPDLSVCHFCNRILFVLHLRNFRQNFRNTVCRRFCDHDHNKYKCNHHQSHHDLERLHDHTGHFSDFHRTEYNFSSSDRYHQKHRRIDRKLHNR